jgi:dienelactone hydrolase
MEVKEHALSTSTNDGVCHHLQSRLQAAINTLLSIPGVNSASLAAFGWCLGGCAILELGSNATTGYESHGDVSLCL